MKKIMLFFVLFMASSVRTISAMEYSHVSYLVGLLGFIKGGLQIYHKDYSLKSNLITAGLFSAGVALYYFSPNYAQLSDEIRKGFPKNKLDLLKSYSYQETEGAKFFHRNDVSFTMSKSICLWMSKTSLIIKKDNHSWLYNVAGLNGLFVWDADALVENCSGRIVIPSKS